MFTKHPVEPILLFVKFVFVKKNENFVNTGFFSKSI
jgi:hypothetical protein